MDNWPKKNIKKLFHKKLGKAVKVFVYRNDKLVTTEETRNYFVWGPNYHATKIFTENVLAIMIKGTHILMNKPAYLELSILELCKTVIYKIWHDYWKPKYGEKAKLYA